MSDQQCKAAACANQARAAAETVTVLAFENRLTARQEEKVIALSEAYKNAMLDVAIEADGNSEGGNSEGD